MICCGKDVCVEVNSPFLLQVDILSDPNSENLEGTLFPLGMLCHTLSHPFLIPESLISTPGLQNPYKKSLTAQAMAGMGSLAASLNTKSPGAR
jgi:hypothetical protein